MKPNNRRSLSLVFAGVPALLIAASLFLAGPAHAATGIPDPCKLITVAEMQQIVGSLKGVPEGTDPKSGEISCG